jgi:hypothetical protein
MPCLDRLWFRRGGPRGDEQQHVQHVFKFIGHDSDHDLDDLDDSNVHDDLNDFDLDDVHDGPSHRQPGR